MSKQHKWKPRSMRAATFLFLCTMLLHHPTCMFFLAFALVLLTRNSLNSTHTHTYIYKHMVLLNGEDLHSHTPSARRFASSCRRSSSSSFTSRSSIVLRSFLKYQWCNGVNRRKSYTKHPLIYASNLFIPTHTVYQNECIQHILYIHVHKFIRSMYTDKSYTS